MARARSTSSPPSASSSAHLGFEAKLWLAAGKLHSNMDAAECKHVVLGLILLKYIYDMKQANLSTNAMKRLKVVLPSGAEQSEVATCFKSLDEKIVVAGRKVAALHDLFRTLLHDLMTAKTRVHNLELSA